MLIELLLDFVNRFSKQGENLKTLKTLKWWKLLVRTNNGVASLSTRSTKSPDRNISPLGHDVAWGFFDIKGREELGESKMLRGRRMATTAQTRSPRQSARPTADLDSPAAAQGANLAAQRTAREAEDDGWEGDNSTAVSASRQQGIHQDLRSGTRASFANKAIPEGGTLALIAAWKEDGKSFFAPGDDRLQSFSRVGKIEFLQFYCSKSAQTKLSHAYRIPDSTGSIDIRWHFDFPNSAI